MIKVILLFSAMAALVDAQGVISSISVCSPSGAGGQGSCPSGAFDTHQIVLGPGAVSVNKSSLGVGAAPDEHSTVFAPGMLGGNKEYLFFVSSAEGGNPGIGVAVLSGGSGPNSSGQWTLDFPKTDGYGSYASGFGQVFNTTSRADRCPVVADGNPAHQDQTFDIHYASAGSVVKDPTAAPGALLMVYEGTNACIGNAGGPILGMNNDYISLAIATSLDYGKSWPTYRGTPTFNFVPMPGVSQTQAPNAPMGALGKNVCMGNDCATPPPAGYGRYPVVTGPTSLASLMGAAAPLTSKYGEQEISGFVDEVAGSSKPYIYANSGSVRVARAQLNGGTAPLTFQKWDGHAFASPGIGGAEPSLLPAGAFENCEANSQLQFGSSISYVEDTQQYLLTFVCDSPGDPTAGQGGGTRGGAWFYSTTYDLSDQTQWTLPREIAGSWSEFDQSGGCPDYKGYYPSFISLGKSAGHLSLGGYVFYLFGCQGGGTPGGRQMSSRAFTITTAPAGTPVISKVANAEGESLTIAPNAWVEIKGQNLAPAGDSRIWKISGFVNNQMPKQLDGVSVTVNGKSAYVYYISPTQVNILTPPDAMQGPVHIVVTGGATSASFTAQAQSISPSFFVFNGGPYIAATHANGTLLGPVSLYPGSTIPAKPGETIVLYANGFGQTSAPVVSGSIVQSGSLSPQPVIKIGGIAATVQFAGLVSPGEFQFNVVVPNGTPDGDQSIAATYNGITTQSGTFLTVQH